MLYIVTLLARLLSHFIPVWLFVTLWTVARQAPLSTGFSRQEYWSGFPGPPPGNLPDPGMGTASLISPAFVCRFFNTSATWEVFDCVDYDRLWKILKEIGVSDHVTCLQRYLYAGQEATVRTGYGTTGWFQIWNGACQGCILSLSLFNLYAE